MDNFILAHLPSTFARLLDFSEQDALGQMASLGSFQSSDTASDPSAEASKSYNGKLPDKTTFIATLSGGAFIIGLTGATIYGLRKAKMQALKEAQELAEASIASASATANQATQPGSTLNWDAAARFAVPSSLSGTGQPGNVRKRAEKSAAGDERAELESSKSRFALFRQWSAAILNPSKRSDGGSASRAPTSVFDDETGTLPSVLRKRKAAPMLPAVTSNSCPARPELSSNATMPSVAKATAACSPSTDTKIDYSEMDSTLDFLGLSTPVPADEQQRLKELEESAASETGPRGFFESPVGLSLKAFLIATSIVTFSTLATVEVTKRALGVETMDEFVVAMTNIIPSRKKGEASLEGVAPHMRVARGGAEAEPQVPMPAAAAPKSVDQALTDLSNASSFEEWMSTLKTQLDTERDFEVARRFASVDTSASNDSISTSRVRPYHVHSALEFEHFDGSVEESVSFLRSVLAISPILPCTAFGLGLISGVLTSGRRAGLVFMAENAHRLPDTVQGWYFYSKTKNYKVLLGAAKGGLKQGARLAVWTTGFCLAERVAELTRGSIEKQFGAGRGNSDGIMLSGHWTDGALAGTATAAAATALYRLPRPSAVRVFQLGLLAGASTGGIRDFQERLLHKEIGGVASHT